MNKVKVLSHPKCFQTLSVSESPSLSVSQSHSRSRSTVKLNLCVWAGRPLIGAYLLQQAELLQLPLVVQDEAVAARPPPGQVLLTADVCHRRVQHAPPPPLHACGRRGERYVSSLCLEEDEGRGSRSGGGMQGHYGTPRIVLTLL